MSVFVVWLDETIIMNFTSISDMIFTQRHRIEWHANQMRNSTAQKSSKMYNMQKHLYYILYQMVPHTYACPKWVCCVWKSIWFIKIQIHLHIASGTHEIACLFHQPNGESGATPSISIIAAKSLEIQSYLVFNE